MADVVIRVKGDDQGGIKTLEDLSKAVRDNAAEYAKAIRAQDAANKKLREENAALTAQINQRRDQNRLMEESERIRAAAEASRRQGLQNLFRENEALADQAQLQRDLAESSRARAREAQGIQEAGTGHIAAAEESRLATVAEGALGLVGIAGLADIFGRVVEKLQKVADTYAEAGKNAEDKARGLVDFKQMNVDAGAAGMDFVRKTLREGAVRGINSEDVGALANPIQSSVEQGANGMPTEKGMQTFQSGMKVAENLVNLGASAEDAGLVVAQGIEKGLSPERIGSVFQVAASKSKMTTAQMASAAPATNFYSSSEMGYAAATAMSTMESPERVREATEALHRAIGPGAANTKFYKKYHLQGKNELEAVEALREYALAQGRRREGEGDEEFTTRAVKEFTDRLGAEGLDIQTAKSVGIAMQKADVMRDAMSAFQAIKPGQDLVSERYGAVRQIDPTTQSEYEGRVTSASLEYEQQYGKLGERGRAQLSKKRTAGQDLTAAGMDQFVNQSTGETTLSELERLQLYKEAEGIRAMGGGKRAGAALGVGKGMAVGATAGALAGAAVGSFFPVVGTGLGAGIGAVGGALLGMPLWSDQGVAAGKIAELPAGTAGERMTGAIEAPDSAVAYPMAGGPAASSEAEGESYTEEGYGQAQEMTPEQRKYYGFEKNEDGSYKQPDNEMTPEQRKYYGFEKNADGSYVEGKQADVPAPAAGPAPASAPTFGGGDMGQYFQSLASAMQTLVEVMQQNVQATMQNTQNMATAGGGGGGWEAAAQVNRNGNS